jgi:virginiamycin B lyase
MSTAFTMTLGQPAFPCTPDTNSDGRAVYSLTHGPDGKLYGTLYDGGTANDGTSTIFRVNANGTGLETVATTAAHPLDITAGPDGRIWYTVNGPPGKIGRIDPTAVPLAATEFTVPGAVQGPRGIIAAPNGALYVLGGEADVIWKVTDLGAPSPSIAPVPGSSDGPSFGEIGPDGRLWFTLLEGGAIASLDLTTNAVSTPIPIPDLPFDVTFGDDGKAYVSRLAGHAIDQVTLNGTSGTRIPLTWLGAGSPTFGLRSPNGNVYFADQSDNHVIEVFPDVPPTTTLTAATATGPTTATVIGVVDVRGTLATVVAQVGPTGAYGTTTPAQQVPAEFHPRSASVTVPVTGLAPATTYHVRLTATNANGTTPSADATFTTPAAPVQQTPVVVTPKPTKIAATFAARWFTSRKGARVRSLAVKKMPKGARVETRCTGKGCAFKVKRRTLRTAAASVSLTSLFKKRTLRVGTKVEVRVTLAGRIGAVVRYTVRSNRAPRRQLLCLPVGSPKPRTGC